MKTSHTVGQVSLKANETLSDLGISRNESSRWQKIAVERIRWGQAFLKLLEERGVRRGSGKGNPQASKSKAATVAALAKEVGVSERTARHRTAQADAYEALPKKQRVARRHRKPACEGAAGRPQATISGPGVPEYPGNRDRGLSGLYARGSGAAYRLQRGSMCYICNR